MGEGLQHQDGHSHLARRDRAESASRTIRPSPTNSPSSSRTAFAACTRTARASSITSRWATRTTRWSRCRDGCKEGVLKGMYKFRASPLAELEGQDEDPSSGQRLDHCARRSRPSKCSPTRYGVAADVWSRDKLQGTAPRSAGNRALESAASDEQPQKKNFIEKSFENEKGVFIAVSDNMKCLPEFIRRWVPGGLIPLGTDGFGRSENRVALRRFFEMDSEFITLTALEQWLVVARCGLDKVEKAIKDLGIDPEKNDPVPASNSVQSDKLIVRRYALAFDRDRPRPAIRRCRRRSQIVHWASRRRRIGSRSRR